MGETPPPIDVAAFYLPQYHPIPENDAWWGRGFTEWTNVTKTRPRFPGHHQPHLPTDLGFYDLRVPEVREQQAQMAREAGITAFCYYHYWFGGKRLLERPFQEVLESGAPDFKFVLCWANEDWTRVWEGSDQVVMAQPHSEADDRAHIQALAPALTDSRCLSVNGHPVLLVYRASHLPEPRRTTEVWREEASRLGIGELHLCRVEAHSPDRGDPREHGFDAGVEFQPNMLLSPTRINPNRLGRAVRRVFRPDSAYRFNYIYEYAKLAQLSMTQPELEYPRYRCVTPGWDNSARRTKWARIFRNSTPEVYEEWLREAATYSRERSIPLLFVNAWNEWSEGNHLEPDQRWGRAYLDATARVLNREPPRAPSLCSRA
jgi:lipopolysaccharide biosynthesis protein